MVDILPLLKSLSEASGVSGYEQSVRELVLHELDRYADESRVDALGNVIALVRGHGHEPRSSVMLAAHLDEIGLVVSKLEEGFIHFQHVGGYDDRILPGQEVLVHGRSTLPGIIGARPPHLLAAEERNKPIPSDKLLIDVGLGPERLAEMVRVGDMVTMAADMIELKGGLVAGKALDNRASVAAVAMCLAELTRSSHQWDVYAVATVQEEIGLVGAITGAFGVQPDIGIAIDVTFARQPGAPDEFSFELGKGPAIGWGPVFHPKLYSALVEAADALEMSYHLEPETRPGGTDADALQISREGIPAGLISIPLRSMHTPVETASLKDVERVGRLLAAFICRLDGGFLSSLSWDLGIDDSA